jgi:hypothetical protein
MKVKRPASARFGGRRRRSGRNWGAAKSERKRTRSPKRPRILMLSTRGSVIAESLKSRASDDRGRTQGDGEKGRKNAWCTCLYLFCIISGVALRCGISSPSGDRCRFYSRICTFRSSFLGTCRGAIRCYSAVKSLPASRKLIGPRGRPN